MEQIYIVTCSVTIASKDSTAAMNIIQQWINQLIDNEDIIHGEIEGITSFDALDKEPDEPLYSFKGFDNYPGHPI